MNIIDTLNQFAERQKATNQLRTDLQAQLADTTVSLEQRWRLLEHVAFSDLLPSDMGLGYTDVFDPGTDLFMALEFRRDVEFSYLNLYSDLVEFSNSNRYGITREQLDTWREAVLASGCQSFTLDW